MRTQCILAVPLPLLGGSAISSEPREPSLVGYLKILEAARDARQACAGLGPDCGPPNIAGSLILARSSVPSYFFQPRRRVAAERELAEAALQAAHADCRSRGIDPRSPRWDTCRVDRVITWLSEVAGLH
jgi:hypothetical protein